MATVVARTTVQKKGGGIVPVKKKKKKLYKTLTTNTYTGVKEKTTRGIKTHHKSLFYELK